MRIGKKAKGYRTKTIPRCLNPVWNETFSFEVTANENEARELELHVMSVMDYDVVGSDDFLGLCVIQLKDLLKSGTKREWYPPGIPSEARASAPAATAASANSSEEREWGSCTEALGERVGLMY